MCFSVEVGEANEQIIEIEMNLKFVSAKFTIVKIFLWAVIDNGIERIK